MDKLKELEILSSLDSEDFSSFVSSPSLKKQNLPISDISAWEELSNEITPVKLESSQLKKGKFHSTPSPRKSVQQISETIPTSPIDTSNKNLNSTGKSVRLPDIKGSKKPFYRYTTEEFDSLNPNKFSKKVSWLAEIKVIRINEFHPICTKNIKNMLKITPWLKSDQVRSLSQTKKSLPN